MSKSMSGRRGVLPAMLLAAGLVLSALLPQGTPAADGPVVYTDLLKNGGFERNFPVTPGQILNWSYPSSLCQIEDDEVHSGAHALAFRRTTDAAGATAWLVSDTLKAVPGWNYRLSLYARCSDGKLAKEKGFALSGKIEWLSAEKDAQGRATGRPGGPLSAEDAFARTDADFDWEKFEKTASAPEGAAFLRVRIGCDSLLGKLLVDDVRLEEGNRPGVVLAAIADSRLTRPLPVLCAPKSLDPVQIDGKLDDAAWREAAAAELRPSGAGVRLSERTYSYVTYGPDSLYIGFRCMQSMMGEIVARGKDRDDNLWQDDCVEVFLCPADTPGDYYHFIVNLTGVIYDAYAKRSSWNGQVRAATSSDDKSWSVEMAIPFETLKVKCPDAGTVWRLNLNREQKSRNELSGWAYTGGAFHKPDKFGYLFFAGDCQGGGTQKGTVRGRILDATGTAGGVEVYLAGKMVLTDAGGRFEVPDAPGGRQFLIATSRRHLPVAGTVEVGGDVLLAPITLKNVDPYAYEYVLPGAADQNEYAIYTNSCLDAAHPDIPPKAGDLKDKIQTFATPGEWEPVTFTIYAKQDLGQVSVTAGPLAGEEKQIPAENLDVRSVTLLHKRTMYAEPANCLIVSPETIETFSALDIPSRTFRQVWITIRVPPDLPAGRYTGKIAVRPEKAAERSIAVSLDVLPIKLLKPPGKRFGIYPGRAPLDRPDYVRDWAEHDVEIVTGSAAVYPVQKDGQVSYDLSGVERAIADLKAAKMRGPIPVSCRVSYSICDAATRKEIKRVSEKEEQHALYVQGIAATKKLWEEKGAPPLLFYPIDEPFSHGYADLYKTLASWSHETPGAKVFVTTTVEPMRDPSVDQVTDVRCYHGGDADACVEQAGGFDAFAKEIAQSGDEAWFYYNGVFSYEQGRAEFSRLVNGFYFWLAPYRVHIPWCYMSYGNDPYDDTDTDTRACEQCIFVYPHPDNGRPIPTVQWEGFREGADDLRYLATLEALTRKLKGNESAKEEVEKAAQTLQAIREELLGKGPTAPKLLRSLSSGDYTRMRRQIADRIVALSKFVPEGTK